jgi:hypothetical protein
MGGSRPRSGAGAMRGLACSWEAAFSPCTARGSEMVTAGDSADPPGANQIRPVPAMWCESNACRQSPPHSQGAFNHRSNSNARTRIVQPQVRQVDAHTCGEHG